MNILKTKKDKFYVKYQCFTEGCNATMIKEGMEHFNNNYKVVCPFCGKNMYPTKLKGYNEYLKEKRKNNEIQK